MDAESFARVRAAFDAAGSLPPIERSDFAAATFPDEPRLVALLERMLAGTTPRFLEPPTDLTLGGAVEAGAALAPGTRLDDFVLERPLGAGGMGEVWLARQAQPARRVAVKVLRGGLETERARARFAEEAEVLARLSHPGIARVFASGVLEEPGQGPRPWFAMELIEGACDLITHARELPLERRLALVRDVAEAVHHGHLRGVLHRDLKPDNLLVDREGRVHVIDFGIARVSEGATGRGPELTAGDELLGTLGYMSPEQVRGDHAHIDMRSDVHALGVLLYELLTGASPWAAGASSWAALAREVIELDPTPPSRLVPGLGVELDWVVAHALAKQPEQRYPSAEALAEDLRRLAAHEPLRAGPPTVRYRTAKFVRRHRAWVTGATVALLLLVLGTAGTAYGLWRATERGRLLEARGLELAEQQQTLREQSAALAERTEQLEQRGAELEASREREQERADRATALNEFLNETLRLSNPLASGVGSLATVGEMLELAAARVEDAFPGRPLLEAETRLLVGTSLDGHGHYAAAIEQLARSIELFDELGDLQAIRATRRLAVARAHSGDWQGAHDDMWAAHARGQDELPADAPERFALDADLGWLLQQLGRVEESIPYARRGIEGLLLAGDEYRALAALAAGHLARALRQSGSPEETGAAYRQAIALVTEAFGERNANTATARGNYGAFLHASGRAAEALVQFEGALAIHRELLGPDHPMVATSLYNMAAALQETGDLEGALAASLECLAINERSLGPDHPETADARGALGFVEYELEEFARAAATFARYAEDLGRLRGPDARRTLQMQVRTADARVRAGDAGAAATLRAFHARFVMEQGLHGELTAYTERAAARAGVALTP